MKNERKEIIRKFGDMKRSTISAIQFINNRPDLSGKKYNRKRDQDHEIRTTRKTVHDHRTQSLFSNIKSKEFEEDYGGVTSSKRSMNINEKNKSNTIEQLNNKVENVTQNTQKDEDRDSMQIILETDPNVGVVQEEIKTREAQRALKLKLAEANKRRNELIILDMANPKDIIHRHILRPHLTKFIHQNKDNRKVIQELHRRIQRR